MNDLWTSVDNYFADQLLPKDAALDHALVTSEAEGLPAISVTPNQGMFLQLLARTTGARRILEIGTLGGYSTIWLARALPTDGRLITLEINPHHAAVAQRNLERAGVTDRVEIRVAPAADTLNEFANQANEPFDFVFIDADKVSTDQYFEASLALSHPGTVIVVDNVVRGGAVADANSDDVNVQAVRRFVAGISDDSRVTSTAVQTVGSKGYDGFILAIVNPGHRRVRRPR
ncbi:MAG TPA: O-methyltransferase [Gemmatimonadaceae bacterium]|jgi:predicted O-methyltransferase YrrM